MNRGEAGVVWVFFNQEDMGESLYGRKASSRERPLTGFIVIFLTWLRCVLKGEGIYIYKVELQMYILFTEASKKNY